MPPLYTDPLHRLFPPMPLERYMEELRLSIGTLCLAAIVSVLVYTSLRRSKYPSTPPTIRTLRGPSPDSFLWGSLGVVLGPSDRGRLAGWLDEFGSVFVCRSVFGTRDILIADPKGMAFVLNRPMEFQRSSLVRNFLSSVIGPGLVVAEGPSHRKQVRLDDC